MEYITAIMTVVAVVITLIAFSNRIERRLTKIETDVSWLKHNLVTGCNDETERDTK